MNILRGTVFPLIRNNALRNGNIWTTSCGTVASSCRDARRSKIKTEVNGSINQNTGVLLLSADVSGPSGVLRDIMWVWRSADRTRCVTDISHHSRWWWSGLYGSQPPLPLLSSWGARSVTRWLIPLPPLWKAGRTEPDGHWHSNNTRGEIYLHMMTVFCAPSSSGEERACVQPTNRHLAAHSSLSHYNAAVWRAFIMGCAF